MEGFKKASFFEKILPDKVEIFSKTWKAWTCFFEYLELIFALFFFIFCFEYSIDLFIVFLKVIENSHFNKIGIVFY